MNHTPTHKPAAAARAAAPRPGGFTWRFIINVLVKALLLFAALNLLFAALNPGAALGRVSAYNLLFPGRLRFPFGEAPAQAYNLSLYNLEAMFSSLALNAEPKAADEFRVLVIGDSSVWGTLLRPQETIPGVLDASGLTCSGKPARFFNLGYPTLSVTKDLMVLEEALRYQPDRILWLVTLEGLARDTQFSSSPVLANNAARARGLISRYDLRLDAQDPALSEPDLWGRTLIGQRRALADLVRLQLYGVLWGATGIDQVYPERFTPAQRDFEPGSVSFHGQNGPALAQDSLALEVIAAGMRAAGGVPVTLVNEPVLVSSGRNSDLRYNYFYPRWAYDDYRQQLAQAAARQGWDYTDLWDFAPESEFTNSAIHLTPAATASLAQRIAQVLGCGK